MMNQLTPERKQVQKKKPISNHVKQIHESEFLSAVAMGKVIQQYLSPFQVQDAALCERAKSIVLQMYNLPQDMIYFPGCLPVSLMRKDIDCLEEMSYMVAEKTDGVRHLMLIFKDAGTMYSMFVDRGFRFFFSSYKFSTQITAGLGTLIDGEMILESTGFKFLVHDIICVGGNQGVASLSYQERMYHVQELLRWHCFPPDNPRLDLVTILPKQVIPFSELPILWENIIPNLKHRCDGLILTPDTLPHTGKKNKFVFKWKHPADHTIDLQLEPPIVVPAENEWPVFQLMTWDTVHLHPFGEIAMSLQEWNNIGVMDPYGLLGSIVECRFDFDRALWVPITLRSDKVKPNDITTIELTIKTMMECLSISELMNISRHVRKEKKFVTHHDPRQYYDP